MYNNNDYNNKIVRLRVFAKKDKYSYFTIRYGNIVVIIDINNHDI